MAKKKKRKDSEPKGAPEARIDYFLTVVYDSTRDRPPRVVTARSTLSAWGDVPMTCLETDDHAIWSVNLQGTPDEGPVDVEFKLVLDGEHWTAGPNHSAKTAVPATVVLLDDNSVVWEE